MALSSAEAAAAPGYRDLPVDRSANRNRDQNTRERIIEQAARLFVARGYHGVSMREVAEAVGVTKPALYHYFADKEALFLALLEDALSGLSDVLTHVGKQPTLRGQLHSLIHNLLVSAPRQRTGLQLSGELKHVDPERRADFEQRYREVWMGGLERLLSQAVAGGELRADLPAPLLTTALLGLLYPLVSRPPTGLQAEQTTEAVVSLFLDGAKK